MLTLTRSLHLQDGAGEPMPEVFPSLTRKGWIIRRGQLTLVAAAPNVGKSAWALSYAIKTGARTLYISADTDPHTMLVRSAAILTGHPQATVEAGLKVGGEEFYEDRLMGLSKRMQFVFDPGPSMYDIDQEVSAFNEMFGEPPELIVVDNLKNLLSDGEGDVAGLVSAVRDLHMLARTTGAAVLGLHHVTGEFEDGQDPPPRRGLYGKISDLPEMIFTLGRQGQYLGMSCVKNRTGPADPMATERVWFLADLSRMEIRELDYRSEDDD